MTINTITRPISLRSQKMMRDMSVAQTMLSMLSSGDDIIGSSPRSRALKVKLQADIERLAADLRREVAA
jgi:hypothetical protein